MSTKKSIYKTLTIESNDGLRKIDLRRGAIAFEYFEDIFSPILTAKLKIISGGNVVKGETGDIQSIYNGLPLRGGERVVIKIAGNSNSNPGLDFSKSAEKYFYVSSITDVIVDGDRESFTLHLTSREAITNETSRVPIKFKPSLRISDSVNIILKDYLRTKKIGTIDTTKNTYGFIGNMRKPFTILTSLASKSVPENSGSAKAGFVFYEDKDGFQFRSLDKLFSQNPAAKYYVKDVSDNFDDNARKINNDFKILNYYTDRNQNLIEKLRIGSYASQHTFFDPSDFSVSTKVFKVSETSISKKLKLPLLSQNSDITLGDVPTRNMTFIKDIGTLDSNISKKLNNDPTEYQSQSIMRYNTIFTQNMSIMVSSNTNLKAGDCIECYFPLLTSGDKKEYDREQSGLYIIKELCHHFDSDSSYTSLKLIRDVFGSKIKR
jgi:hypothetical protein